MIYGSICSGIEAATAAWHPLGWKPAFFSEIDAFPRAVLAHHYPDVPLHGDFTTIREGQYAAIDVLVGGTPCQSFSVAGLRAGLDDERGNLALEFCRLARRLRPRWVVWENVPGVLSLDGGRAFASILGGLAECGYGLAYRVLDAQFVRVDGFARAVPQRRRRVFVVGCLGDWRRAAAVLFERESMSGNPAPRRQAGQGAAKAFEIGPGGSGEISVNGTLDARCKDGPIRNQLGTCVAHTLNAKGGAGRSDSDSETFLAVAHALRADGFDASEDGTGRSTPLVPVSYAINSHASAVDGDQTNRSHASGGPVGLGIQAELAYSLRAGRQQGVAQGVALRGREEGATAELTGEVMTALRTGGGGGDKPHVLLPVAAMPLLEIGKGSTSRGAGPNGTDLGAIGDPMFTLQTGAQHGVAIAFDETQITSADNRCNPQPGDPCHPLARGARPPTLAFHARQDPDSGPVTHPLDTDGCSIGVLTNWRVRRLTPVECDRLQGFPDGYTAITHRGKPAADGPRYKALGNSMAVNVMRWIGSRIEMADALGRDEA